MRGPSDPAFDPARPQANRVYGRTAQTTMIDPVRLAAVPLTFTQRSVATVSPAFLSTLDEEGMMTLLCALVTQSGWKWEPALFATN